VLRVRRGQKYIDEILRNGLKKKHDDSIRNAFSDYGKDVTEELHKVIVTGTRSGRVYKYRGREYIASAPGEPPANRSGRLANSFGYKARQQELVVYTDAEYAAYLEDGTRNMSPRPYFVKTNQAESYKLYRRLNEIHS